MNPYKNYILRLNAKSKAEALQAIELLKEHIKRLDSEEATTLKVRIESWKEGNGIMELVAD